LAPSNTNYEKDKIKSSLKKSNDIRIENWLNSNLLILQIFEYLLITKIGTVVHFLRNGSRLNRFDQFAVALTEKNKSVRKNRRNEERFAIA
jgi:hypothetical protein